MKNEVYSDERLKYLELLSRSYKNIDIVTSKIIDLKSVLFMPKPTEHFLSDVHGEYEAFYHVVNNASGVIKNYIIELFDDDMNDEDKALLATLIYYPKTKLRLLEKEGKVTDEFLEKTLSRLIALTKRVGSKYNREKVVAAFPEDLKYILSELIFESPDNRHKELYYKTIFNEIISMKAYDKYIYALSMLIKRFAVETLHIVGDIYDRGPSADNIVDFLINHHNADIQYGNHDVVWYGAYTGSEALVATAIRNAMRYNELSTIEDGYGINLLPLVTFALKTYADDPCYEFYPKGSNREKEFELLAKAHKAIAIIQFKAESQIINRHPEFKMEHRDVLKNISDDFKTVDLYEEEYELKDSNFPTLENGIDYTDEEREVIEKLTESFRHSVRLGEHMKFLADRGDLYKVVNDNLLLHACMPLDEDGNLKKTTFLGHELSGKNLLDVLNKIIKEAYYTTDESDREYYNDIIWYLWCGEDSPLFGKTKMTTFERYFIEDKSSHKEPKNPYFNFRNDEEVITNILKEFKITSPIGKMINGHVPVKEKDGENPIKAGGKLLTIDGGFSQTYQKDTGIAGYTLISNSYGLVLATHEPLKPIEEVLDKDIDITSDTEFVLEYDERRRVGNTDAGKIYKQRISDLEDLLNAYKTGVIKEKA